MAFASRAKFAEALSKTSWGDKSRRHFLTREEEYVNALQAALGIWEKMRSEKLGVEAGMVMRQLVDFPGGLELHIGVGAMGGATAAAAALCSTPCLPVPQ